MSVSNDIHCLGYLSQPTLGETLFTPRSQSSFTQSCSCKKPTLISQNSLGCSHRPTLSDGFTFLGPCHSGSLPSIYLSGSHTGLGSCGQYYESTREGHTLNRWFERSTVADKDVRRHSTSLAVRETANQNRNELPAHAC